MPRNTRMKLLASRQHHSNITWASPACQLNARRGRCTIQPFETLPSSKFKILAVTE